MKYISTRSKDNPINSAEAILKGIADDGGLFVPEKIPTVSSKDLEEMLKMSYEKRAAKILGKFLTDYTADELSEYAELAYNWFDAKSRIPMAVLVRNNDNRAPYGILELWHGPTSAFKDVALQMLPRLMTGALKKTGEQKEILILVATSGDTGKAALAGFADVPQTKVMVFYPDGGVSKIQRLQMVTQTGNNVNVTAVRGNFDDAQTGVKKIFADEKIRDELDKAGVKLSSANSINWGRLVPQIVYYFSAYLEFVKTGKMKLGEFINVSVPTGNFGNILAAYYAKKMGLPIRKLICASNINHVLTDFFNTGIYDRNREFHKTITPSMDILISSNLERLIFHESGGDFKQVKRFMTDLNEKGKYKIDAKLKKNFDKIFFADYADEAETKDIIGKLYQSFKYPIDTHTAVAMSVALKYRNKTKDGAPMVVASTASPYKFTGAVLEALGQSVEGADDLKQLDLLNKFTGKPIPKNLDRLADAKILHEDVCEKDEMPERVIAFAKK